MTNQQTILSHRLTRPAGVGAVLALLAAAPAALADEAERTWAPPTASASAWSLSVGGGVGVVPHYEGADRSRVTPVPFFSASYRDIVKLGIEGLGVTVLRADGFTVTPTIGYGGGRKESTDSNLKGLGTIQSAVTAGLVIEYEAGPFSFTAAPRKAVVQSRDGFETKLQAGYTWHATPRLSLGFGPELSLVDGQYERTYFGVDAQQAARSGKRLYHPGGGVKDVGLEGKVTYALDDHWTLLTRLSDQELVGDAADSPIVRAKNQATIMTGVTYHF